MDFREQLHGTELLYLIRAKPVTVVSLSKGIPYQLDKINTTMTTLFAVSNIPHISYLCVLFKELGILS